MATGKLSRRLFLLTLVALIPAAVVLFYNLYSIQTAKDSEVHSEALRAAQLGSLEMKRIISGAENVLIALSAASVIQQQDAANCEDYLTSVGVRLPQFSGISLADVQGKIVCRKRNGGGVSSIADRSYFKDALRTGVFVVGEYSTGRISNRPVLPLALPIKNDDGEVSGVIVGALSLDWLGQRLRERDFAQNGALTIADGTGIIIARAPQPLGFVGTSLSERVLKFVHADRPGTFTATSRDGIERIVGFYPASGMTAGLFVSAGISTDEAYGAIRQATWIGLVATLASLFLSFVLAWLTSTELIRRPVGKLIATIEAWRGGDEAVRTGMSERSGEFGIVGKAIDDFLCELVAARQVAARAEEQRELVLRELDHRIKNLLATVQSMARQTFRETVQVEDAVAGFNRRLAALSEAHGLLMKDNWQSAGLRDVVIAATRPFNREQMTQFEITGPNIPVKAKAVLSLSMALHELCTNAVKYGALKAGEGRIGIDWTITEGTLPKDRLFRFVWTEYGGPPVIKPDRFGFGSKMIERVLSYELEGTVDTRYAEAGVVFTLVAPLQRIRVEAAAQAA